MTAADARRIAGRASSYGRQFDVKEDVLALGGIATGLAAKFPGARSPGTGKDMYECSQNMPR